LTSLARGSEHHVTVPAHKTLKVGTLGGVLTGVAEYLKVDRAELMRDLFDF
jgi:phage shock protein PspC (stress-responsive transcriptional regulator)